VVDYYDKYDLLVMRKEFNCRSEYAVKSRAKGYAPPDAETIIIQAENGTKYQRRDGKWRRIN
jgi:hypothetical protein